LRKDLVVIAAAIAVFGLSTGLQETMFPLLLDVRGLTMFQIGSVFTASMLPLAFITVLVGGLSDTLDTAPFFIASLLLASASHGIASLAYDAWTAFTAKILFDLATVFKNAVVSVMLFRLSRDSFVKNYSIATGLEFTSQAVGLALAGVIVKLLGYEGGFILSSFLLATIFALALIGIGWRGRVVRPRKSVFSIFKGGWGLNRELWVLALSGAMLSFGTYLSHGFIPPLYFTKRYGLNEIVLSALMTLHRLSLGLPMLAAYRPIKLLRRLPPSAALAIPICVEGVSLLATPFAPSLLTAVAFWLPHDLLGASIWIPLRNEYVQRHCREDTRGLDTNKVSLVILLGGAPAPIVAGIVAEKSIGLPFIASGLIVLTAATTIFLFYKGERPSEERILNL